MKPRQRLTAGWSLRGPRARLASGRVSSDFATMALLSAAYAIALFQRTALPSIAPQLQAEFALTPVAGADLAAVFFWTYLMVMIPTGILADAIGARRVALAGCMVSAAGALLFSFGRSVGDLSMARMLIAAGSPAAFVGLMRFVALTFPERKATLSGRGILVGNIGAVCSGAPLALLLGALSWRDVWLGAGIASLALAGALAFVGRRTGKTGQCQSPPRNPGRELVLLLR